MVSGVGPTEITSQVTFGSNRSIADHHPESNFPMLIARLMVRSKQYNSAQVMEQNSYFDKRFSRSTSGRRFYYPKWLKNIEMSKTQIW